MQCEEFVREGPVGPMQTKVRMCIQALLAVFSEQDDVCLMCVTRLVMQECAKVLQVKGDADPLYLITAIMKTLDAEVHIMQDDDGEGGTISVNGHTVH